jgi:hypothetical protein
MRGLKFLPLIVLAVLVWFLFISTNGSEWLASKLSHSAHTSLAVGRVMTSTGAFTRIHDGAAEEYKVLPQPIEIFDGDRLETHKDSTLLLALNSQDELEMPELSSVSFQIWNPRDSGSPLYLQNLMGSLNSKKTGIRGKAYVVKDGKLFLPGQKPSEKPMALTITKAQIPDLQLADSGEEAPAMEEPAETAKANEPELPMGDEPLTLSNEYIDEMIVSRQGQLQKCWLSRLKDNPNLRGSMTLQFEISRRGKVRELRVATATFDDETLKRCVMTVVERIAFRPYKGQEISLSYPITFE